MRGRERRKRVKEREDREGIKIERERGRESER